VDRNRWQQQPEPKNYAVFLTTIGQMSVGDVPPPDSSTESDESDGLLRRFLTAENGPLMFLREMLTSVASVAAVGLLLFALSGVWPPMVAVESGSMEPNMQRGDLIFLTEPGRLAPDAARGDTGVVTPCIQRFIRVPMVGHSPEFEDGSSDQFFGRL
jgi:hypothetical protein